MSRTSSGTRSLLLKLLKLSGASAGCCQASWSKSVSVEEMGATALLQQLLQRCRQTAVAVVAEKFQLLQKELDAFGLQFKDHTALPAPECAFGYST